MTWLIDWLTNPFFYVPILSWLTAQVIKVIINLIATRQLKFERLFGDGGMPSGHAATVTSLAATCALRLGTSSVEFAIAIVLCMIICHDATGVRQEAGKHAMLLTEIIQSFDDLLREKIPEVKLKKLIGHTFLQVLAGAVLGVGMAFLLYYTIG